MRRMQASRQLAFNPLSGLKDAAALRNKLDAFEAGHLREAAAIWEQLEQRDDLLRAVISKRKKAAARHGWTVLPKPGLAPEEMAAAREHARALEFFYRNAECENAMDTAERGGFKLLARQMMDAVGKRFAVHEMVWRKAEEKSGAGANQNYVTARFRFVPLGFFENTTGRLRFLASEWATEGRELEPGAWLVTAGEGLMMASAAAWLLKHVSLETWLACAQTNGTPRLRGSTPAARGSADWTALEKALKGVIEEGEPLVHATGEEAQVLNLLPGGTLPFPQLVERIDRLLAALWRGADLSTISRDRGYGASLQEKEACVLEEDDAELLTETLNRQVDEWVIRHVFGPGVKPLAGVKVLVSPRECTMDDIQIDRFLLEQGAPLSVRETMTRYGRALPEEGDEVFQGRKFRNTKGGRVALGASSMEPPNGSSRSGSSQNPGAHEASQGDSRHALVGDQAGESGIGNQGPSVSFRGGLGGAGFAENAAEAAVKEPGFAVQQPDWVQLSPLGDYPHARGLQRVDRAAVEGMAAQFHSFRGKLGRLFGGLPFYAGHPDMPGSSELADRKAYGWITDLAARADGLYGYVQWSDAGGELLRNAHYKYLSPYWEAAEIGKEEGRRVFRPTALLSAGLTNQPNIPVKPLANENKTEAKTELKAETKLATAATTAAAAELPNTAPLRLERRPTTTATPMHTSSLTLQLGRRRAELGTGQGRGPRIQERVQAKMRLGLSYDQAWENAKEEFPGLFEEAI